MSVPAEDDWSAHWGAYAATSAKNPAQAYRRTLITRLLALGGARAPVRVLDLGSGSGELAGLILRLRPDAEVVGLDLAESAVALARKNVPGALFFQQDLAKPIALDSRHKEWATHAVCSEVLEHLDDATTMLRNARHYLARGCRLIVTVPAGPMSAFDRHIGHRRHFSRATLEATLRAAGFEVGAVHAAGFPFFNLYRLAVIARGAALIDDASDHGDEALRLQLRVASRVFSRLFALSSGDSRYGWQLAAVARAP